MIWILAIAALIVGLLIIVVWDPFKRNIGLDKISDWVRHLLTRAENGSFCRFDHRASDLWFSFERFDGSDTSAILSLRVPRQERTEIIIDALRDAYETHGFEWTDEVDNPSLIGKIIIPVKDIWAGSSGATGAHAACILLDALGVSRNARFDIEEGGTRSRRMPNR